MRIKIDPINYNIFRYVWIFLFVTSADIMRQQKLWRRKKIMIRETSKEARPFSRRPENVNFETWGLNCKLDGLGGIDGVFFVLCLLCDDNYNYNWLWLCLRLVWCLGWNYSSDPSSGHEIFRSSSDTRDKTRGDRGDDELIHYPGQHGHGPAANTRGQEMVALQRNLSTFKWILRGQRNQWSDSKSVEECQHR